MFRAYGVKTLRKLFLSYSFWNARRRKNKLIPLKSSAVVVKWVKWSNFHSSATWGYTEKSRESFQTRRLFCGWNPFCSSTRTPSHQFNFSSAWCSTTGTPKDLSKQTLSTANVFSKQPNGAVNNTKFVFKVLWCQY